MFDTSLPLNVVGCLLEPWKFEHVAIAQHFDKDPFLDDLELVNEGWLLFVEFFLALLTCEK